MPYEKVTKLRLRLIVGMKQSQKAMENGKLCEVFIADDAEKHITLEIANLANKLEIPCQHVDSMKKLGRAARVEVGASIVAVKK